MHPAVETWIALVDGTVDDAERSRLLTHLERCAPCREREREVQRVLEALARDRLLRPSESAVAAVLRAIRPARAAPSLPDWARGLVERAGRIVFDSFARPRETFAGARSAPAARRIRFEAADLELDVLIETRGDRRRLTAQVLDLGGEPTSLAGTGYLVSSGDRIEAEGEADAHGGFVREIATPGEIEIRVAAGRRMAVFRIVEHDRDVPVA